MLPLLITTVSGMFFLIGSLISLHKKENDKLTDFCIGLAFSVMVLLLAFDLFPEANELFTNKKWLMYVIIAIGLILLKLVDLLIPHHDHETEVTVNHHERHLSHIGLISSIALIIHNIIEGMTVYSISSLSMTKGILMAIAIGLHNIPFGIEITAMLKEKLKTKSLFTFIIILSLSTTVGGILILAFNKFISDFVLGVLTSLTIGMILYIALFELLQEIMHNKNKKNITFGIVVGIVLMSITILISDVVIGG